MLSPCYRNLSYSHYTGRPIFLNVGLFPIIGRSFPTDLVGIVLCRFVV